MPQAVDLRPASEFSSAQLASSFNAGYEGYAFPMNLDAATFSRYANLWDYDLGRSRVALADGAAVGIAVLAIRGSRGWIGGMGVAAGSRGTGVGRGLLEAVLAEAKAARLTNVSLEVLEGNDVAIRLYRSIGFEQTRMLEVWTLDAPARDSTAATADVTAAHEVIRRVRTDPEPWQRDDETVAHLVDAATELRAFAIGDDAAAIVQRGAGVSLVQLGARDPAPAGDLIAAARVGAPSLSFVNVPEGSATSTAFAALGGRLTVRQHEMALTP